MEKIVLAKTAGFCFGVNRAIAIAAKFAQAQKKIYSIGPIIHNTQVVNALEKKGVKVIEKVEKVEEGSIIIPSHGLPIDTIQKIKKKNLQIIDVTCPLVKRVQDLIQSLSKGKYDIVIIGDKAHPEVASLLSYAGNRAQVVQSKGEALKLSPITRMVIICQTTQSFSNFKEIVNILLDKTKELKIYNTICHATDERQREAIEIARKVNLLLIVGSKKSANTCRLHQICKEIVKSRHIETSRELKRGWFRRIKTVGVTAGASTPKWIIDDVVKKLQGYLKKK